MERSARVGEALLPDKTAAEAGRCHHQISLPARTERALERIQAEGSQPHPNAPFPARFQPSAHGTSPGEDRQHHGTSNNLLGRSREGGSHSDSASGSHPFSTTGADPRELN
ncbi:hypothetical protein ANCCAN_26075 [Ancylostoma caninum]|uniref:Uncharacterized protein n=1 Tax=Ancylostoma caninum TaxID=29170 RepID=A0A368FBI2_ANCCA|nr:hypothetical protein ANCCAN_26075 [Ancylostoma caninum]